MITDTGTIDLTGLTTATALEQIKLADGTNNLKVNAADADKIGTNFNILGGTSTDTVTVSGELVQDGDLDGLRGIEVVILDGTTDSSADTLNLANDVVASNETITINATSKQFEWTFDGSAETDGKYIILGSTSGDTITGGAGADRIAGGAGADKMTGGAGADTFEFKTTAETSGSSASADTTIKFDAITDFNGISDKIKLGTGVSEFGTLTFTNTTSANVTIISSVANNATLGGLLTNAETASAGVASTSAIAQILVFTVDAAAGAFANKTIMIVNDNNASWTVGDRLIDITNFTSTVSAANFEFDLV